MFDYANYEATVIVTSDTCFLDNSKDTSGQFVVSKLTELGFKNVQKIIVQDDKEAIKNSLIQSVESNILIVTVGGTGLCPRDVTPDVTLAMYDKTCTGISIALITSSLCMTPMAALSRLSAGIIRSSLVINFPGKLKACSECFSCIEKFLQHALEQVVFDSASIKQTHSQENDICVSMNSTFSHGLKETSSLLKMVSYDDALRLMSKCSLEIDEKVLDLSKSTAQAIGSILAEDLSSNYQIPTTDVSMMDGYVLHLPQNKEYVLPIEAILVKDIKRFKLLQSSSIQANSFFCYPINTGNEVPRRNFTIVPIEHTRVKDMNVIEIQRIFVGEYVRKQGTDLDFNDKLSRGTEIGPVELGIILSMRHTVIKVLKKPIVGILTTGDELIDANSSIDGVVDVNGPMLVALLRKENMEVVDFGRVKDNEDEITNKLKSCLSECNVLVVTGGASMGTKDYVKMGMLNIGCDLKFGKVNMKPGKPVSFGSISDDDREKAVFSLPGNPASAYITCLTLVIPYLKNNLSKYFDKNKVLELSDMENSFILAKITEISEGQTYNLDSRMEFLRAKFHKYNNDSSQYNVSVSVKQQSSRLWTLKDCDCLLMIPPGLQGDKLQIGQIYPGLKLRD